MKIVDLKCPSCNGALKIDSEDPKFAVCEYCKSRFLLEQEEPRRSDINNKIVIRPSDNSGKNSHNKSVIAALGLTMIAIFAAVNLPSYTQSKTHVTRPISTVNKPVSSEPLYNYGEQLAAEKEEADWSALLTAVFEKSPEQVTDEEIASVAWICVKREDSVARIGYSTENPYENPEAQLTWSAAEVKNSELNQLYHFAGLVKVDLQASIRPGALKGLSLAGLACQADSPGKAAELVDQPELLKELKFNISIASLDGIDKFPQLTRLSLKGSELTDLTALASLKQLEALEIIYGDALSDFSVLQILPQLKEISIDSEGLKSLNYFANMTQLNSLSLKDADMINLKGLEKLPDLKILRLESCDSLNDASVLSGLTGLTELDFELPYNCEAPDLRGLTAMRILNVRSLPGTGFLGNMANLESLTLNNCSIDNPDAFGSLVNLKELKCIYSQGVTDRIRNWNFLTRLPALERLDLTGVATYEDLSPVFGIPSLQTLLLNGVEGEINFGKLSANPSLKHLEMDGIKLYNNVQITGSGGMYSIYYDDVQLEPNLGFLGNYPNLENLSLADNKLSTAEPLASLNNLISLNIAGNYITDLKPLGWLTKLEQVTVTGNPVENYRVLPEDVVVNQ